MNLKKSNKY